MNSMIYSENDIQQIQQKGLTPREVDTQIALFKKGAQTADLHSAATIGDGIKKLNSHNVDHYSAYFERNSKNLKVLKFVPASGAATRMFKFLYKFLKEYDIEEQSINSFINQEKLKDLSIFRVGMEKFPFYHLVLQELSKKGIDFNSLNESQQVLEFAKTMMDESQLNYGNYPKGLLPFHLYKDNKTATAFEEHLYETALYVSKGAEVHIHFTISKEFESNFREEFKHIVSKVMEVTERTFNITFSYQKESTDTIAVTPDNQPFLNPDGSILFRPSGHGALIDNLNDLDADIVFVKNIDNVVTSKYKDEVALYKKVLAGILLDLQQKVYNYQKSLEKSPFSEEQLIDIATFLKNELNVDISKEFEKYSEKYKIEYLQNQLNKPIRVCGMVKNEGEPGGGPFWVKDDNGRVSLQIVEAAQIDKNNKQQRNILKSATHFNPVDLVCGLKNNKGEKYNLHDFVEPNAAFITKKTQEGKDLKALEKPGLWNGSMAYWNTVFVEVPLITFNPVKTVNDLLKPTHQVKIG